MKKQFESPPAQLPPCHILGIFVGSSKTLNDERGAWQSSIARDRVDGVAILDTGGFRGDRATQPYHGSTDSAVCIHSQTHYNFWNATLAMNLQPGAVGENLTIDAWDETHLCIGDVLRVGTASIQISAARTPCENQARYIGRPDWVRLTLQELRTGIYARVIKPGTLKAGDSVRIAQRLNPGLTLHDLNRCTYQEFDPEHAERLMAAEGLTEWWKVRLRRKMP